MRHPGPLLLALILTSCAYDLLGPDGRGIRSSDAGSDEADAGDLADAGCVPVCAPHACGADGCGGTCDRCVDGETCHEGTCVADCVPESEEAFCTRLGLRCGRNTARDTCGTLRTATCGSCRGGDVCDLGTCHATCTPESNTTFCTRLDHTCGDVTGADNCGATRTAGCGGCGSGLTCSEGSCVETCSAETNGAFCRRLGKDCGPVTAADNCGASRTVTCGTCDSDETCGAAGPNVCGCTTATCTGFTWCDPASFACASGCARDGQCAANETCQLATHACQCPTHTCSGHCVDPTSVATCGTRCDPCPTATNAVPTCDGTTCGLRCSTGYTLLDGQCVKPQWRYTLSGTTEALRGVWGAGDGTVWAVGESATLLRYDGVAWGPVSLPIASTTNLHAVHGVVGNVWVVGARGTALHWTGTSWTQVPTGTTKDLYGVHAISASDAWAVGPDGTVLHWNGFAWVAVNAGTSTHLYGVWAASAQDIWLVGGATQSTPRTGIRVHWNGTSWSSTTTAMPLSFVGGRAADDVWATGEGVGNSTSTGSAPYFRWNGSAWTEGAIPRWSSIAGIAMPSATDGWAALDESTLYHWDGTTWTFVMSTASQGNALDAIWAGSSVDVWAVGSKGLAVHYGLE